MYALDHPPQATISNVPVPASQIRQPHKKITSSPSNIPQKHTSPLISSPETVNGAALPFEGINHIEGRYGLSSRMLGVRDRVTEGILQKSFEDSPGFFINKSADTLDTAAPRKTANSGLCDTGDIVLQNFRCRIAPPLPTVFWLSNATFDPLAWNVGVKDLEGFKTAVGDKFGKRVIITKKKMGAQTTEANNNQGLRQPSRSWASSKRELRSSH